MQTMQVAITKKDGIHCDLEIQIPSSEVDKTIDQEIIKTAKTIRIDGFRPGKVPAKFIRQRHGTAIRSESINKIINDSIPKAIAQEKLHVVGMNVDIKQDKSGEDFIFTLQTELYPEIQIENLDTLEAKKATSEVTSENLEKMIETLRKQHATLETVERAAAKEDTVTIDFKGFVDGETFEGGEATAHSLVLGSGQMIPGFEDAILGMNAKDEKVVQLTFPEDYNTESLKGKNVEFKITLHKIETSILPDIDEAFIAKFEIEGDETAFRKEIESNMKRELKNALQSLFKEHIFTALRNHVTIEVPKAMLQQEIDAMKAQFLKQFGPNANIKASDLPNEGFTERAEIRIKNGLIAHNLMENNKIKANENAINTLINELSVVYTDPEEFKAEIRKNTKEMENIQSRADEDALIEWVSNQMKISDEHMDFFDIIRDNHKNRAF